MMKIVFGLLPLIFFLQGAVAANVGNRIFLPVLVCQSAEPVRSLAIFEAQNLRGLHFDDTEWKAIPFDSLERDHFFNKALSTFKNFSPARSFNYLSRFSMMSQEIVAISEGHLDSKQDYFEIGVPKDCVIKTLAVLEMGNSLTVQKVYFDKFYWNQLSGLGQASAVLEVFAIDELLERNSEPGLAARIFAGYALLHNGPLKSPQVRFEVLKRLGFQFAELEDFDLCINLKSTINWSQDTIISASAVAGAIFNSYDPRIGPGCFFNWKGQVLNPEGYFKRFDSGDFKYLSIKSDHPYRDEKLSNQYGVDLLFSSFGQEYSSLGPLLFSESGQLIYGVLLATKARPVLKWQKAELSIGLLKFKIHDDQWSDTKIAFWPNGIPRMIYRANGRVLIRSKWYEFNSDNVYFYESGQLECARFLPGTRFQSRNNTSYVLNQNNAYVCFSIDGYPIELDYSGTSQDLAPEYFQRAWKFPQVLPPMK
jgi:hypothetical protein